MLKRTLILTAFVSLTASTAFAQGQTGDTSAPPPPPPPADTTAPPPDATAPPPPAATTAPPTETPKEEKKDEKDLDPGGRVRWGVSGNLGWHLPQSMFTIGGEGRIGYQVSNIFSAYAAIGGTAGFGFSADIGFEGVSVGVSAISYWYVGAIAEAIFKNRFYVGGGPVLARGALGGITTGVSIDGVAEVTEIASAGFKPGLNLRFGLSTANPSGPSRRRGGFNIGIDALFLFHPSAVFVTTRADGPNGSAGVSVTESALGVSFVPMLTLGYDSR
ncbi:hypothetical protein [Polyangium jinanense]|uniref:Outer membrane protein beta-barrel domain-containing protein n=1 Tax=Polyangium jinanense TaxID=2829994 RepID=A0A9X3X7X1_9BACT|nr:hypothetical protein [Polyangium jinanense]MDC3983081.1 hypothetical protein [Polyangium jinanense]